MTLAATLLTLIEQATGIAAVLDAANEALRPQPAPRSPAAAVLLVDCDPTAGEMVVCGSDGFAWRGPISSAKHVQHLIEHHYAHLTPYYSRDAITSLELAGTTPAHRLLGLSQDAPREVVDAAYRALARKLHPDSGGSDAAMAELTAAYAVVKEKNGWT